MPNSQSEFPLTLAEVLYEELDSQHPPSAREFDQAIGEIRSDTDWQGRYRKSEKLVKEIYAAIHSFAKSTPAKRRSALCLSGGGVRSAIFNLGVLQGLARCGLLEKFDYLSTVSGGGFIGSWLSAWINRAGRNVSTVVGQLSDPPENPLVPEPTPLYNLRIYANYLTPKKGLLSVDTWTLIAIYLRNLLLNWMVFVPTIMAFLMLPRIWVAFVKGPHLSSTILLAVGFAGAAFALGYIATNLPAAELLNFREGRFVYFCLAPLVISAMALTTYWFRLDGNGAPSFWQFIIFALLLGVVPWVFSLVLRIVRGHWHGGLVNYAAATLLILGAFFLSGVLIWYVTDILNLPRYFNGVYFARVYASLAVPLLLVLLTIGGTLIAGFTSRFTDADDQEWWARSGAWILIVVVGWSVFHLLVLFGPTLFVNLQAKVVNLLFKKGWAWEDIKGVGAALIGIISGALSLFGGTSSKTPAQGEAAESAGWSAKVLPIATSMAAVIFGAFIVIVLALVTNWILASSLGESAARFLGAGLVSLPGNDTQRIVYESPGRLLVVFALLIAIVGWLFGRLINTNRFSLHYYWRNRMMRAYLGATRDQADRDRTKNQFTDFDLHDNLQMYELNQKPMHVVNVTLNLAGGNKLEWQDRKAESFSISPLHAGSYWLGYRNSREYGGDNGISLATSVAISGAAASPNMGYMMSSPVVRFIMTLFNVRMGFWLGNPGPAGTKRRRLPTFHRDSPRESVRPIVEEALGLTNDQNPYVYLSDGGHFDNFGLYEMILRRCRFIIVSDASTDPDYCFESLAYAIRQVRVDFGVPIEIRHTENPQNCAQGKLDRMHFGKNPDEPNKYCAIFDIRYSCVDKPPDSKEANANYDGTLIYIKPSMCGSEPADVLNYHKADDAFPEDTIADQWFSEPQFESYRMLGSHMIKTISPDRINIFDGFSEFIKRAEQYLCRE